MKNVNTVIRRNTNTNTKPVFTGYAHLKIAAVMDSIAESIMNNQITIVSTPTGSGKSLGVPRRVYELTDKPVFCLVPRIVIADRNYISAIDYVCGGDTDSVGILTSKKTIIPKNCAVIYCTEMSFKNRGLMARLKHGDVLLVDEVHEQGVNLELILLSMLDAIQRGAKVVLMSATFALDKYIKHFESIGLSVGLVQMKETERPFPLHFETVADPIAAIREAAKNGGRVLVGCDGKETISDFVEKIGDCGVPVFQIHGENDTEEQTYAFGYTEAAIYVATNIIQSGVTIPFTHGYFTGLGKRIETVNGENALMGYKLSKAEMKQWFGRLGRTCEGTIFQTISDKLSYESADENPTPNILLASPTETALVFKNWGLDIASPKMLNKIPTEKINSAHAKLQQLGCLDTDFNITEIGKKVCRQQASLRQALFAVYCEDCGIDATVQKLQALNAIGHPFRDADMSKLLQFANIQADTIKSEPLGFVKIIETIADKFRVVDNHNFQEFADFCKSFGKYDRNGEMTKGIFRTGLLKLIKAFTAIDKESSDELYGAERELAVRKAYRKAYADQVFNNIIPTRYGTVMRCETFPVPVKPCNKTAGYFFPICYGRSFVGNIMTINNFTICSLITDVTGL